MFLKKWIFALLMLAPALAAAQVDEALEQWAEEGGDDAAAAYADELLEFRDNPLNINDTTVPLPLLSPFQRQALRNYIILHGQLLSHKELLLVPGFDSATVALLAAVTVVEPFEQQRHWRMADGRHSLVAAVGGQQADSLRALAVYTYSLHNRISFRLAAEKDAYEPWGKDNFYSYHLMLTDIGRVERLIVGRYNVQFGQGLTLWTGLKPFNLLGEGVHRFATGVRPASTFYEEGYQEGAALTVRLLRLWHATAFASKANGMLLTGGRVAYRHGNLVAGTTLVYTGLDDSNKVIDRVYNRTDFQGQRLFNAGVDALWQWGGLLLFGEAAMASDGGAAAIGGARLMIDSRNSMGISYRDYGAEYHNLVAQPYSVGGNRNERGWTLDARLQLPLRIEALLYADLHSFPSLRYGSYQPSSGAWLRAQIGRQLGRNVKATLRYAWSSKERNVPNIDSTTYLGEETLRRQLQGEVRWESGRWRLSTRAVWAGFTSDGGVEQSGWLVSQQARYTYKGLRATAELTWFDVSGYYARIYLTESTLQYAFSIPSYNGRGLRTAVVLNYAVSDSLALAAKHALMYRLDGSPVGSLLVQMRLKF